jgi:hypothetical protein
MNEFKVKVLSDMGATSEIPNMLFWQTSTGRFDEHDQKINKSTTNITPKTICSRNDCL